MNEAMLKKLHTLSIHVHALSQAIPEMEEAARTLEGAALKDATLEIGEKYGLAENF